MPRLLLWQALTKLCVLVGTICPHVATTMSGVNEKPWSLHCRFVSRWLHLKSSYRTSGASGSRAEAATISSRNPLVAAKSQAAAGPPRHLGMYTSAGRRKLLSLFSEGRVLFS